MHKFAALILGLALLAGGRYWLGEQADTIKHEVASPASVPTKSVAFIPPADMTFSDKPIQLDEKAIETIDKFDH